MPIKIVPIQFADSPNGITLGQLNDMSTAFMQKPGGGKDNAGAQKETTRYALFPIKNILDLLVANKICLPEDKIGDVASVEKYAIKVFFAQHVKIGDCPKAGTDFIGRNTVVLVATQYDSDNGRWVDLIRDSEKDPSYIEITGYDSSVNDYEGSDKTNLCPPQCQ